MRVASLGWQSNSMQCEEEFAHNTIRADDPASHVRAKRRVGSPERGPAVKQAAASRAEMRPGFARARQAGARGISSIVTVASKVAGLRAADPRISPSINPRWRNCQASLTTEMEVRSCSVLPFEQRHTP